MNFSSEINHYTQPGIERMSEKDLRQAEAGTSAKSTS